MKWWKVLTQSQLQELYELKENKFLRPYAKLIILLYKYEYEYHYTNAKKELSIAGILREVLGGNYMALVKEGVLDGLIRYARGEPPRLTQKGVEVAKKLLQCWKILREKERET
ncbi:MAG: hypothetical protein F7C38_06825 [Desulfurococcales archaeon]|nr:hypothetical protein [Desulfurococcales archaeon]